MPAAIALGLALPTGTLSGDAGRLLITFLGLFSASVLPTVSLVLGSMTASGRSVKALDDLKAELSAAIDALFLLFGLVVVSISALISLAIPTPNVLAHIPYVSVCLQRTGQAVVVLAVGLLVSRGGQIPGILRRALEMRHKIAVDEARRKTLERAPDSAAIKSAFPTHPDFGRTVNFVDPGQSEPH